MKALLVNLYRWHPNPPFFYGWVVLAAAAMGAFIATSVAQTVLGGIQDLIVQDMNWDRKTIALAATLGTWGSGLTMPFIGKLVDRFGPRWLMLFACFVVGLGSIYLAGSSTVWQFFLTYILIRAIAGPNLQNLIPRTIAVNFFTKRRNLAMGITALNRIAGESVNIQIITALSTTFSWRTAYRFLGYASLPLSIPIFLLIRHRPENVNQFPDSKFNSKIDDDYSNPVSNSEKTWSIREILSLPSFWLILTGEFVAVTSTSMVIFQTVPYLVDNGTSYATAATALTLGNILGGVSVPLWGWLTDRFTTKKIASIIMLAAILPTTLLAISNPQDFGFTLVVTWTTATGVVFVLGSMMLGTVFSRQSFGTVTGLTGPSRTAAMGLGPTLGAFIIGWFNSYQPIFLIAIVGYILVVVLYYCVKTETYQ